MLLRRRGRGRLWLPVVLSLGLHALLHGLNQVLAATQVAGGTLNLHLSLEALFLLFPLLYLRFAHGLPQVAIVALMIDAMEPQGFGSRLIIYSLMLVTVLPLRVRLRRENPAHVAWLAFAINLVLHLALLIVALWGPTTLTGALFWRTVVDFALSQTVVLMVAFPWLQFQRWAIIQLTGEDPAAYAIGGH